MLWIVVDTGPRATLSSVNKFVLMMCYYVDSFGHYYTFYHELQIDPFSFRSLELLKYSLC